MDSETKAWLKECVGKGTFASEKDGVDFCVLMVKYLCEWEGITQQTVKQKVGDIQFPLNAATVKNQPKRPLFDFSKVM